MGTSIHAQGNAFKERATVETALRARKNKRAAVRNFSGPPLRKLFNARIAANRLKQLGRTSIHAQGGALEERATAETAFRACKNRRTAVQNFLGPEFRRSAYGHRPQAASRSGHAASGMSIASSLQEE